MTESIGIAAGKVWNYLNEYGPSSATKITKETKLDSKLVQRAIGWLAKEDKLQVEVKGRTETFSLK